MCEQTVHEQLHELLQDTQRLQQLIDLQIYVKINNIDQPTKIYPLDQSEHNLENLRNSLDIWQQKSKL